MKTDKLKEVLKLVPDDLIFAEHARREAQEARDDRFRRILRECPIHALTAALSERMGELKKKTGKMECVCGETTSHRSTLECCRTTYRNYVRNRYRIRKGIPLDKPITQGRKIKS